MLWLVATGFAQEPTEEVVVTGTRLSDARAEVERALRDRGYFQLIRVGDRSYWLTNQLWKPWVMVHREGFARIRGVPVLPLPAASNPDPSLPPMANVSFIIQSRRAVRSQRERLADALEPRLGEVRDALWERARAERGVLLVDELVAIWMDGIGPGGEPLPTAIDRRAALVERWLATEPDEAGEWARERIVAFVEAEVQTSDHPFRAEEIAAANARRGWPAPFEPGLR